jgi:hypothetical protein
MIFTLNLFNVHRIKIFEKPPTAQFVINLILLPSHVHSNVKVIKTMRKITVYTI